MASGIFMYDTMENKKIEICSLITGLVFILSGGLKAFDASSFAQVIATYGFGPVRFLSPVIILLEITLGLLLLFRIYEKALSIAGAVMVSIFTLVYLYGWICFDVQDCGCFGQVSILNSSPTIVLIRNGALLFLLGIIGRNGENRLDSNLWVSFIIFVFIGLSAFVTGYTYNEGQESRFSGDLVRVPLHDSRLSRFVECSADSTYVVFAFSYTCPHCLNSIANLKEYEAFGVADRVVGLALGDSLQYQSFVDVFNPGFVIRNHSEELFQLTDSYPKAYYIKNNTILVELSGELPCALVFKKYLERIGTGE